MADLTAVLLYAALLVIVTSVLSLRTRDPDPMLGGRNMPWWLIGASIVGSTLSSVAFLILPGVGYSLDLSTIISYTINYPIGGIITYFFFVAFLRKSQDASIYTLLRVRFGTIISLYTSTAFIVFSILFSGIVLCLVGKALGSIVHVDPASMILCCGLLVIFYTYMTGIEGVIWTDFFQTSLFSIGGLFALFFIASGLLEDFGSSASLWTEVQSQFQKDSDNDIVGGPLAISILFFVTSALSYFVSDQSAAQRYLVARSDNEAKKGILAANLIIPILMGSFMFLGVLLCIYYQQNPGLLPQSISQDTDKIFAHFISQKIPNGLLGFIIISILAAAMSTIDTRINSASTVLYCNFWKIFHHRAEIKVLDNMSVMRTASLVFGVLILFTAYLVYIRSESVLSFALKSASMTIDSMLGLYILMRISKKAGPKSAIIALITGISFVAWATLSSGMDHPLAAPFHYMWGLPIGTVIMVITGLIASRVFHERTIEIPDPFIHTEEARQSIAKKRKRAKKDMFSDSIRPKQSYRLYALIGAALALFLKTDPTTFGLSGTPDPRWFNFSAILMGVVAALPYFVHNSTSGSYMSFNLGLLSLALPFTSAALMFHQPDNVTYCYFFLISVAGMGTMVGWTMLGIGTMLGISLASIFVMFADPGARIPDHAILLSFGTIAILVFYAMDAAKERIWEERNFTTVHIIINKIQEQVSRHLFDLKKLNWDEMTTILHSAEDIAESIKILQGATNVDPEESQMELSVHESIQMALKRVPEEVLGKVHIQGNDFFVLGSRSAFENIIYQILDNAVDFIHRGESSQIKLQLDDERRLLRISNDGPSISPKDVPYIFDLGYTNDSNKMGLGLSYCQRMMNSMRGTIRLTSKPHQDHAEFTLYFPFSYDGKILNKPKV